MDFSKSTCKGTYLHKYEIIAQYPQGILEMCDRCGKEVFFSVINDTVDNNNYLNYHMRQALPKNHPLFAHEYPQYA